MMSNMWSRYEARMEARGRTQRQESLRREQYLLSHKLSSSLSYHTAIVDGVETEVAIINSDNLDEKLIYSMPGGDFKLGVTVDWANNHWLITEKDANNEIYTKAKLLQCNYLLKWIEVVDNTPKIIEQWCVIDDGTKYMTGTYQDRLFIVVNGDTRIALTIGRNEHTAKFNRQTRILVDDPISDSKQSFKLTKPLKVGKRYNEEGCYEFVLSEANTTDYDNFDLMIPDYYKYFPDNGEYKPVIAQEKEITEERGSWI